MDLTNVVSEKEIVIACGHLGNNISKLANLISYLEERLQDVTADRKVVETQEVPMCSTVLGKRLETFDSYVRTNYEKLQSILDALEL